MHLSIRHLGFSWRQKRPSRRHGNKGQRTLKALMAQTAFGNRDYENAQSHAMKADNLARDENHKVVIDALKDVRVKILEAKKVGADTTEAEDLFAKARPAMVKRDYRQARIIINQALAKLEGEEAPAPYGEIDEDVSFEEDTDELQEGGESEEALEEPQEEEVFEETPEEEASEEPQEEEAFEETSEEEASEEPQEDEEFEETPEEEASEEPQEEEGEEEAEQEEKSDDEIKGIIDDLFD